MRRLTTDEQARVLAEAMAATNELTDALSQDTFSGSYPSRPEWAIGPFERDDSLTYVLESQLNDPSGIGWTSASIINPSVIDVDGELVLFFRASPRKESLASRIGVARRTENGGWSTDSLPAVFPTLDNELWGCEDPKIYRAEGRYFLFYNGIFPVTEEDRRAYPSAGYPVETVGCDINLAVSDDLVTWQKLGPIIDHETSRLWAKGAVIPRDANGSAVRIGGEYLMYLSEGCDGRMMIGRSTNMIDWTFDEQPYLDLNEIDGRLHEVACVVVDDDRLVLDFFYDDREHRFAAAQALYSTRDPFTQIALNEGGTLSWGGLMRRDGRWTFAQGWDAPADTRTLYFYRESEYP